MAKMTPTDTRLLMERLKTFTNEGTAGEEWSKNIPQQLQDLKVTLGNLLPRNTGKKYAPDNYDEYVKDEKLLSKDPLEFEVHFVDGTVVKATKVSRWNGRWSFDVDGEVYTHDERTGYNEMQRLANAFEQKYSNPMQRFEKRVKAADWYYNMADDAQSYSTGKSSVQAVYDAVLKMTPDELHSALPLWNKYAPKEFQASSVDAMKKMAGQK